MKKLFKMFMSLFKKHSETEIEQTIKVDDVKKQVNKKKDTTTVKKKPGRKPGQKKK